MNDSGRVREMLRAAGIAVESVYDFVNGPTPPEAVPVLVDALGGVTDETTKEGIARALACKEARGFGAERALLKAFLDAPQGTPKQQHTKWAIGMAISALADIDVFDQMLDVALDPRHGWTRSMIVEWLGSIRRPRRRADKIKAARIRERAIEGLSRILEDEVVRHDAIRALGNLQAGDMVSQIRAHLTSDNDNVRREAKRALKKLGAL